MALRGGSKYLIFWGLQIERTVERERREGEKKEKRKRREEGRKIKGMDSMIFGMDITWKVRILWFCMEF